MTPTRRDLELEATRTALLAAARAHFAASGYAAAEVARIAADAGVTTGALYHHFGNKKALFQAVAEQIEAELLAVAAAAPRGDPWLALRAACDALIDACAAPDVQRIIFTEAPQVLGPDAWREIELRYAYGAARAGIAGLMAAGVLRPYPVEFVVRALLGLLREAAAETARDPRAGRQVRECVARFLDMLQMP